MKYRIGNRVFNSEHIVKVQYMEASPDDSDPNERQSACGIKTVRDGHDQWSAWLRGDEADAFWAEYSADALNIDALKAV